MSADDRKNQLIELYRTELICKSGQQALELMTTYMALVTIDPAFRKASAHLAEATQETLKLIDIHLNKTRESIANETEASVLEKPTTRPAVPEETPASTGNKKLN